MMSYADAFLLNYSTPLLADAAFRAGVPVQVAPAAIKPLNPDHKLAGPVRTVTANNDLVSVIAALHRAGAGDVLLIANRAEEVGAMGDLIGMEGKRKQLGGFVVDGLVRDRTELLRLGVPVFCRGCVPVGPLKVAPERRGLGVIAETVTLGEATIAPGDWAFGDGDGVIFLRGNDLPAVFEQAATSQAREVALTTALQNGAALGDLLAIESFLEERAQNPAADFNAHLKRTGRAI